MHIIDAHRNFHQKYSITTNGNDDGRLEKSGQQTDGTPSKSISQTSMRRLPAIGFIIKMHTDNTFRFVSRGASTSLTQVSQWITRALKALFSTSEKMWIDELAKCAILATGSWVIDDAAKVKLNLHRMNVERLDSKTQGTFDFSSMYTTLDLEELKNQMTLYVQMCFDNSRDTILKVHSRENHKWLDAPSRPSANSRCFDADTLIVDCGATHGSQAWSCTFKLDT